VSDHFLILRREHAGGYSTRGPIAQPMSLKDARAEVVRLKKAYPHQDFVIMGEVGEATLSERVTVKIDAPDLTDALPKPRKPRKTRVQAPAPQPALPALPAPEQPAPEEAPPQEAWNVVPLRKEELG
jgi:hypothetical protein